MEKKTRQLSIVLIVFAIIGILISLWLGYEHYIEGPLYKKAGYDGGGFLSDLTNSVCGGKDSFVNCAKVSESKYSTVASIPLAILGIFYFVMVFFLSLFVLYIKEELRLVVKYLLFWVILLGALTDLALFFISIFAIKALCTLCTVTYGIIWLALILMLLHFKKNQENPLSIFALLAKQIRIIEKQQLYKYAVILVILFLGSILSLWGTNKGFQMYQETATERVRQWKIEKILVQFDKQKKVGAKVSNFLMIGREDAPVTIVEFSDFLCPACKRAAKQLENFVHEEPDLVKLIFVNFPLDEYCNPIMRRQLHAGACKFARGSICAAEQSLFKQYYEIAFSLNKRYIDDRDVAYVAAAAGLDVPTFQKCMASPSSQDQLMAEIDEAVRLGFNSTPTILINDKLYRYVPHKDVLKPLVEQELRKMEMKGAQKNNDKSP